MVRVSRGRFAVTVAVVPLTVLAASTAGSARTSAPAASLASAAPASSAPALPEVPTEALDAPASRTTPRAGADRGLGSAAGARTVANGAADLPTEALAAYQRAAAVMGPTDPGCRLEWPLLAAIGHVESDHGRHGGSELSAAGVATPAIVGPRLDGRRGTSRIRDSDAGELDGDRRFDRAVGPMQFIPSTWSAVGVDADGDGRRDPQDIDDAALAAGVYLCSGSTDLSTADGRREALLRYNRSTAYARLVLELMAAYADPASTVPLLAQQARALPGPMATVATADRPVLRPRTSSTARPSGKRPGGAKASGDRGRTRADGQVAGTPGRGGNHWDPAVGPADLEPGTGEPVGPGEPTETPETDPACEPEETTSPEEPADPDAPTEPAEPTEPADAGPTDEATADGEQDGDEEAGDDGTDECPADPDEPTEPVDPDEPEPSATGETASTEP